MYCIIIRLALIYELIPLQLVSACHNLLLYMSLQTPLNMALHMLLHVTSWHSLPLYLPLNMSIHATYFMALYNKLLFGLLNMILLSLNATLCHCTLHYMPPHATKKHRRLLEAIIIVALIMPLHTITRHYMHTTIGTSH